METTEIMTTNEEVMEMTEEIAQANSGKAMKVIAGVGLAVLMGSVIYKFAVKPLVAKAKAKKEEARAKAEIIEGNFGECDVEEDVE